MLTAAIVVNVFFWILLIRLYICGNFFRCVRGPFRGFFCWLLGTLDIEQKLDWRLGNYENVCQKEQKKVKLSGGRGREMSFSPIKHLFCLKKRSESTFQPKWRIAVSGCLEAP